MEMLARSARRARILRTGAALVTTGWLLTITGAPPAAADVFIPDPQGTKRVPATIEVDWGVFETRVSRRHVVAEGETLRGLARRFYEDEERWKEIADANSDAVPDPDVVRIGTQLWIPPRDPPAADADDADPATRLESRYEAFWVLQERMNAHVTERASPGEIPDACRGGMRLSFVGLETAKRVSRQLAKGEHPNAGVLGSRSLHAPLYPDTLVADDDPTVRVVSRYRLTGRNHQLVSTEVTRTRYDAEDQPVTADYPVGNRRERAKPSDDAPARWPREVDGMVALLGLAIVVGGGIVLRRGRSDGS